MKQTPPCMSQNRKVHPSTAMTGYWKELESSIRTMERKPNPWFISSMAYLFRNCDVGLARDTGYAQLLGDDGFWICR